MKDLRKILKLTDNKMNKCYFTDEKLMHIKVTQIITYHLNCSHRQRIKRNFRLDPDTFGKKFQKILVIYHLKKIG